MTSPTPKCHLLLVRAQASLFGWRAQKPNTTSRFLRTTFSVNHFTVVRSVTKSINESEAGRDLALILSIFVFKRKLVCIKSEVCIKKRSPDRASLSFLDQVTDNGGLGTKLHCLKKTWCRVGLLHEYFTKI